APAASVDQALRRRQCCRGGGPCGRAVPRRHRLAREPALFAAAAENARGMLAAMWQADIAVRAYGLHDSLHFVLPAAAGPACRHASDVCGNVHACTYIEKLLRFDDVARADLPAPEFRPSGAQRTRSDPSDRPTF